MSDALLDRVKNECMAVCNDNLPCSNSHFRRQLTLHLNQFSSVSNTCDQVVSRPMLDTNEVHIWIQVAVNGKHFVEFPHRFSYQSVKYLYIDGSVNLTMIRTDFETPKVRCRFPFSYISSEFNF